MSDHKHITRPNDLLREHLAIETEGDKSPVTREQRNADEVRDMATMLAGLKVDIARRINAGLEDITRLDEKERAALGNALLAIARDCQDASRKLERYVHDAETVPEFLRARA